MTKTSQTMLVIIALIAGLLLATVVMEPLALFVTPDGMNLSLFSATEPLDVLVRFAPALAATFVALAFTIIMFRRLRALLIVAVVAVVAGTATLWVLRLNVRAAAEIATQFEGIEFNLPLSDLHLEIAPLAAFMAAALTVIVLKVRRPEIELEEA